MLLPLFPTQRNWRKTFCKHIERIVKGRNSFSSLLACGLEPRDNSVLFVQSDVTISLFCSVECLPLWIGLDFGKQHQYQSPSTHAPIQRQNRKAWQQGGCVCQSAGSSFLPSLNDRRYHDVQRNAYYSVRFSRQMCPWEKIRFNMWRWLAISSTTSIENTTFISIYQNLKCLWVELAVGCEIGRRIMSLSDGKKKMSKSSQTQFSNISIIGVMQCKSVKHRLSRANSRVH